MDSFRTQQQHKASRQPAPTSDAPTLEQLGQLDQAQLQALLTKQVQMARQNGTLDNQTLETFLQTVSPYLSAEQRQKLQDLIKVLSV